MQSGKNVGKDMKRILIDSDVILDFVFDREPFVEYSAKILNLCYLEKVSGFITPIIFSNINDMIQKEKSRKDLKSILNDLIQITDVVNFSKNSIREALNSDFNDFEDALQNFSAEQNKIDIIVTRNIKDYKHSNVPVMNPENFLKTFNSI